MNPLINKLNLEICFKPALLLIIAAVSFVASEGFGQWAEPTLTPRITTIKASHINELRTEVNTKLVVCGQPAQVWTHNTLTPRLTSIKKTDIDELRLATTNLVNAYRVQQSLPPSPPVYTDATITARATIIKATHIQELRGHVSGATCVACVGVTLAVTCCSGAAPTNISGTPAVCCGQNSSGTPIPPTWFTPANGVGTATSPINPVNNVAATYSGGYLCGCGNPAVWWVGPISGC